MPKEIKLYGEVNRWGDVSHENLSRELKGYEGDIAIRVHSPGGSVFEGWAIFNLLQLYAQKGFKITFYVDGIAASMMSFIIQAGHEIYASENSMLMVHAPSGYASGQAKQIQDAANLLKKIGGMMEKEYQRRSAADKKEVASWMEGDNWFTPEEALKAGLIDGIVPAVATRKMEKSLSPQQAYEAYSACMTHTESKPQIKMKEVTKFIGLPEAASESDVLAQIKSVYDLLEKEKARATKAENDLATFQANFAKEKAIALVAGAIQANKVAPGDKEKFEKLAQADYETTQSLLDTLKPVQSVSSQIQPKSEDSDLAAEWDELHKSGKLEALKNSNPERYKALFAARYPLK